MQRPTHAGFLVRHRAARADDGERIMVDFEAVNGGATIATGCGHPREYRIARNAYEFTADQVGKDSFDEQLHRLLAQELAMLEPNLPAAPGFEASSGNTIAPDAAERQVPHRPITLG